MPRYPYDYSFFESAEQENAGEKNRSLHPHSHLCFPLTHFPVPRSSVNFGRFRVDFGNGRPFQAGLRRQR